MGMPLHLAFKLTHHELLTASGERWAEVIIPEDPIQLEMTIATGETWYGMPDVVCVTVHRHFGTYKGREQVRVGVGLVGGGDSGDWVAPAASAAGGVAIRSRAGATSGHLRWSAGRTRVEILDRDGQVRVVLSPTEIPPVAGERFRGLLHAGDRSTPMLHVALVDGDRPRGKTWVTRPEDHLAPANPPRTIRHELLGAAGRPWALVMVPLEAPGGCGLTLFSPDGAPEAGRPAIQLGLALSPDLAGSAGGAARRALLWYAGGSGRPEQWRFPEPGPAGSFPLVSHAGVACGALEWTADRARVALTDWDGNSRVVISFDEPPPAAGERCRLLLRPFGSALPLHVQLIDGALPAGATGEYVPPMMP
ncbi:MAG TPA: hypothetical protein VFU21_31925 [Kofleriaceae bacterium]|nr:hypothetical protein [Kofleriaceae bacterium]